MDLNEDEVILGTAARFLFESGKDDEANLLLTCSLTVDEDDEVEGIYTFIITAPAAAYAILSQDDNPTTREIRNALYATTPKPTAFFKRFLTHRFDAVVGYPDYDDNVLAKLRLFARGDNTPPPIIEVATSRQRSPHMLITPLEVFSVKPVPRDETLCFVMMPFDLAFNDVYRFGIKQAIENVGLVPQRGDDIQKPGDILAQIWEALLRARFVIADLTRTNGNVLYELGLAHVLGHHAILLTQQIDDIPFDLRAQRHIQYLPTQEGIDKLRIDLERMMRNIL